MTSPLPKLFGRSLTSYVLLLPPGRMKMNSGSECGEAYVNNDSDAQEEILFEGEEEEDTDQVED